MKKHASLLFPAVFSIAFAHAQCGTGESEVYIDIHTDPYAHETYWELVPAGAPCGGSGTIFSGGNTAVGCNGAGAQNEPPGGYGNNTTITEGPWCFPSDTRYDIIWVDDWGDGGLSFTVKIDGLAVYHFSGTGLGNTFPFETSLPVANNAGVSGLLIPAYMEAGSKDIKATLQNYGSDTIHSLEVNWSIDNGPAQTETLTGLSIMPLNSYAYTSSASWLALTPGTYTLRVWTGNVNGHPDVDVSNNEFLMDVIVGPDVPNMVEDYLDLSPVYTVVADVSDGLSTPRDLDFHTILTRNELWVVNKNTENSGGSTVTIFNAGKADQSSEWRRDGNAWHFMSLPTGIAFGDNTNFATSTGVFDANHNGGDPFTGPSLWSSDTAVYARPSGGNGSHIDMLHESPECQGIAAHLGNAFWVFDGYNNDIVYYDFRDDHGPGNDDHSDGIIRRYSDVVVAKDPGDHIVSHLALDADKKWLYVTDHGNDRIFRMDVTTGNKSQATPGFGPWEPLAEYSTYTGYIHEDVATTGLTEPSGIAIIDDRLMVSDHANGDIIMYDVSGSMPAPEIGRIQTGQPGIMGITIGPEGKVWFVNAATHQVIRMDADGLSTQEQEQNQPLNIYPNPANSQITLRVQNTDLTHARLYIYNISGKLVGEKTLTNGGTMNIQQLATGLYHLELQLNNGTLMHQKLVKQ